MKTPLLPEFKAWSRDNHSLAMAVLQATAFAQCERERVDGYIIPLFNQWTFHDDKGERKVKVHSDTDGEFIFAHGKYSMAPIFRGLEVAQ